MTEQAKGIGRVTAALVAIAAMLPYLTLKVLWLTGSSIGVTDPGLMRESTMVGLNAMTFGMDAVALVLALAFSMRWGLRLPAWLVLLPLWVGTGLLVVVAVTAPLALLVGGPAVFAGGGPIQPWVYMVVYGGFVGQAAGLTTAFVLYARARWPRVLTRPFTGPRRSFHDVVAWGALAVAAPVGGTWLVWAVGAPSTQAIQGVLRGLLAIGGAAALVALVRRRGGARTFAVAWLGSGSLFANGLYSTIVRLVGGPLAGGPTGAEDLVSLFGMLTGLVMGMCGAFLLAERSGVGDVQPAQEPLEGEDRERDRQPADHRDG
ncbi:hypothetical protein ABZ897_51745 [Nonomuraea sp. NPDC046802]|uniref:hypothetical protein n=1 Tax=Nonomuraea sp. NPDC046802 TaxID=3154919 RepID=UPI0033F6225F